MCTETVNVIQLLLTFNKLGVAMFLQLITSQILARQVSGLGNGNPVHRNKLSPASKNRLGGLFNSYYLLNREHNILITAKNAF